MGELGELSEVGDKRNEFIRVRTQKQHFPLTHFHEVYNKSNEMWSSVYDVEKILRRILFVW